MLHGRRRSCSSRTSPGGAHQARVPGPRGSHVHRPAPGSAISSCSRSSGRSTRCPSAGVRPGKELRVHRRKAMDNVLDLVTTDQMGHKLKMIVVSWVHSTANERYIEISATNEELGQLLVRITTTGG